MKKRYCGLIALLLAALLSGCSSTPYKITRFTLNTTADITLYGSDKEYLNEAFDLITKYERLLSRTVKSSEIYKINNTNGEVAVSVDTANIIKEGLKYYSLTDGAFDISLGRITEQWDFEKGIMPAAEDVTAALEYTGAQKITVKGNKVNANGTKIDLGAIAKGYISDKLVEYFKSKNVENAVINLGGNVTVMGDARKVGIKKLFSENETVAKVNAKDTNVVTSGVYERCFMSLGIRFHHIIDPKTGFPADTDLLSATVICKDGAKADALSTCCILLGRQNAEKLIESMDGVEAIFVDENLTVTATKGLKEKNGIFEIE